MGKIVFVIGSPGAGKSSIISAVKKKYSVVTVGDFMEKAGRAKRLIKHRDEIRYLTPNQQKVLQADAFRQIGKLPGEVVLDTHATVEQHGRFYPGMADQMLRYMKNIVGVVYVDAPVADILKRRKVDKSRKREIEPEWLVERQRDMNFAIASYYSTHINIPLYLIVNKDGALKQAQKQFIKSLKDAFGE